MKIPLKIPKISGFWLEISLWAFFVGVAILVYWNGIVDFPRRDQVPFLEEKAEFHGAFWPWFRHAFSYNRTRFFWPGDYYLFRPLHMSLLVFADYFFNQFPKILGGLSLVYLGTATWALFQIVRFVVKSVPWAIGISLVFLVFNSGRELVLWRHISPYLLALAFFALGILFFWRWLQNKKGKGVFGTGAFLFFFLASSTHEIIAISLLIATGLWILIFPKEIVRNFKSLALLASPAFAYLVSNIVNFIYYNPKQVLGPADNYHGIHVLKILQSIWWVLSASSVAFLFPPKAQLEHGLGNGIARWPFQPDTPFFIAAGCLFLVFIAWVTTHVIRKGSTPERWMAVFSWSLILAYAVSIGIGRVYIRGLTYFFDSTYYHGIFAFCICMILGVPLANPQFPRWSKIFLGALLVYFIAINLSQLIPGLQEYYLDAENFYER